MTRIMHTLLWIMGALAVMVSLAILMSLLPYHWKETLDLITSM